MKQTIRIRTFIHQRRREAVTAQVFGSVAIYRDSDFYRHGVRDKWVVGHVVSGTRIVPALTYQEARRVASLLRDMRWGFRSLEDATRRRARWQGPVFRILVDAGLLELVLERRGESELLASCLAKADAVGKLDATKRAA